MLGNARYCWNCFPRLWGQSEALHGWVLHADSAIGGSDFALISKASSSVREWDIVSPMFMRGRVFYMLLVPIHKFSVAML